MVGRRKRLSYSSGRTHSYAHPDANAHADPNSHTDADADPDPNSNADADPNSNSHTDADPHTNSNAHTDADACPATVPETVNVEVMCSRPASRSGTGAVSVAEGAPCIVTSYLLCSTERVGSYLLADALESTGIAGRPGEHFHRDLLNPLVDEPNVTGYDQYFSRVVEAGSTPNGVWAGKMHWSHLENLMRGIRQVYELQHMDAPTLMTTILPNLRYVWLTRRDKVRQAVSLLKAIQSGVWWQLQDAEAGEGQVPFAEPTFHFAAIDHLIRQIEVHETSWHAYFRYCGAQPLVLTYEELVADLPAATRRVLGHIGVEVPPNLPVATPRFKKQADPVSEEWVERYQNAQRTWVSGPGTTGVPTSAVSVSVPGNGDNHARSGARPSPGYETGLSVIVVSHNEGENLRRTVESLLAGMPAGSEVVVVDDKSTDGSAEAVKGLSESVVVRSAAERLGVAKGRNFGAGCSHGNVLVFTDAHVEVSSGWSAPLLAALAPLNVGVVAPVISASGAPHQKGYGGYWGSDATLSWRWGARQGPDPHPVPLICGCFLAMRRDVFDAVGEFDRGFVLWGTEDAEISLRLWTLGYECLLVPEVDVSHVFRSAHPYAISWETVLHNMLRLAIVHFREERVCRLIDHVKANGAFPAAWAHLAASDAWNRGREIRATRVHDDDWFFRKFGIG